MEKVVGDRQLQMNRHEPVLTNDAENSLGMTYYMKTIWSLVPIGLILFIMFFSAAIYYFLTDM